MLINPANPVEHVWARAVAPDSRSDGVFGGARSQMFRWFLAQSLLKKILLVASAVLFASPIGTNKLLVAGELFVGDPLMLLTIAASMLFLSFRATLSELASRKAAVTYAVLFLLFVQGIMTSTGDLIGPAADFRCAALLVGAYFLCKSGRDGAREGAIYALGMIAFVSLLAHMAFFTFLADNTSDDSVKKIYPGFALLLLGFIALYEDSPLLLMLCFPISIFVAATSFYRGLMLQPLLLFVILMLKFFQGLGSQQGQAEKRKRYLGLYLLYFAALAASIGLVRQFVLTRLYANEGTIDQGITKTLNLLKFFTTGKVGEGDDLRVEYLRFIGSHLSSFLLPSGFNHRTIIGHWGPVWSSDALDYPTANSLDGMHLFFAVHFGILLSIVMLWPVVLGLVTGSRGAKGIYFIGRMALLLDFLVYAASTGSPFSLISNALFCGAFTACLCYRPPPPQSTYSAKTHFV